MVQKAAPTQMDRERQELAKSIMGVLDSGGDIARMPENVFVTYYLPFFRGDTLADETKAADNNYLLESWLQVSGGPLRPIRVFDHAGATLYEVPALCTTAMFNAQRKEGSTPFAEIVKMAQHYSLISPVAEENHTTTAMEAKFRDIYNKNHQLSEREQKWLEIFARYEGTVPRPATAATATSAAVKPKDDKFSDDEMIF